MLPFGNSVLSSDRPASGTDTENLQGCRMHLKLIRAADLPFDVTKGRIGELNDGFAFDTHQMAMPWFIECLFVSGIIVGKPVPANESAIDEQVERIIDGRPGSLQTPCVERTEKLIRIEMTLHSLDFFQEQLPFAGDATVATPEVMKKCLLGGCVHGHKFRVILNISKYPSRVNTPLADLDMSLAVSTLNRSACSSTGREVTMIDFRSQIVLIMGGSRGIGAACAESFARAGADVVITFAEDGGAAERIVGKIRRAGQSGLAMQGRIESAGDCRRIARGVIDQFGKVDILVNAAGIWEHGPFQKMSPLEWKRTIDVNLTGTFNACSAVVPYMRRRRYGKIVNVSSTAGQRGEAMHSHYAASKGGIIAFTKSLGAELIREGIWVNCVAPGWVDTDMIADELKNPKRKREILSTIPRGKVASPEEIAGPILFLASRLADNVVGEILNVNGGSVLCG